MHGVQRLHKLSVRARQLLLLGALGWIATGSLAQADQSALEITSPAPGDCWATGSGHYVTWTTTQVSDAAMIRIEYLPGGSDQWIEVAAGAPNSGRYLWTVPAVPPGAARLRLTVVAPGPPVAAEQPFQIAASQQVTDYEWIPIARKAAFAPRDGAGALVFQGRMWLLGGWNPGDRQQFPRICNNEVFSSSDGRTWTLVKPNTFLDRNFDPLADWEGRHTAGYAVHRGKMWIVGGDVNQGHYQNDVWNSSDGKTWHRVNADQDVPWGPRALHYTLAFQDRIWVLGGQTMPAFCPAKEVFYRDIWNTTDGVHWTQVAPREPYWSARGMIGGNVVFQDRMWILGGGTYDTPDTPQRKFYNDVWSSADGVNWSQHLQAAPWQPRQYHEVAVFDGRMWVLEGYHGRNLNDVRYSADGTNWYELAGTPWKPRHAASVFVHDGGLWMVAGNNMESDVWKLVRTAPSSQTP